MIKEYAIHDVCEYINWIYFFHAWGFPAKYATIADIHTCEACYNQWVHSFPQEEIPKAKEAIQLFQEAQNLLREMDHTAKTFAIFQLKEANSEDDDLIIGQQRIPMLRQQTATSDDQPLVCLSDFVRPLHTGADYIGIFATSVHYDNPSSENELLVQTIEDRLAEATAEKLHLTVRKELWGYAPNESLSIKELLQGKYQGIRPAIGYPSLPDLSINFILNQLIDMRQIGITLTDNGMMIPHASVSGFMIAHPQAYYFSVGKIDQQQLSDYARRRGFDIETAQKFLLGNII